MICDKKKLKKTPFIFLFCLFTVTLHGQRQKNKKVLPVNSEIEETKEKSFKEKVAEAEKQYQEFIKDLM